jgi:Bifunctional DNA primase/polymerase, N-terminal
MPIQAEFARLIGATPDGAIPDGGPPDDKLTVMLDWALHWAGQGLHVFPAAPVLGTPILIRHWHSDSVAIPGGAACSSAENTIVQWWSKRPDADIGCVPSKSGHFIVAAIRCEKGLESLERIEEEIGTVIPDFETDNTRGDRFLWFKGKAPTNYQGFGAGLYVLGAGHYVYLPPSQAPSPRFAWGKREE